MNDKKYRTKVEIEKEIEDKVVVFVALPAAAVQHHLPYSMLRNVVSCDGNVKSGACNVMPCHAVMLSCCHAVMPCAASDFDTLVGCDVM